MSTGTVQTYSLQPFSEVYVEKALIGHIMLNHKTPEMLRCLEPASLGDSLNRAILAAIRTVEAKGEGVDLVRVLEQMREDKTRNDLEFAGGLFFLYECMDLYAALGKGPLYAQRIVDLASKCKEAPTPPTEDGRTLAHRNGFPR